MTTRKTLLPLPAALLRGALALAAAAVLAAGTSACDDPLGFGEADVTTDTLTLSAPTGPREDLPSAVDLVLLNTPRFPERVGDAGAWDLALRQTAAGFFLLPASGGGSLRGAGVTPTDRAFDQVRTAPTGRSAYLEEQLVPLVQGQTYLARSREYFGQFSALCVQYSKLRALELNAAQGTARLEVVTAVECDDDRLTED